jgi:hypothetical protein
MCVCVYVCVCVHVCVCVVCARARGQGAGGVAQCSDAARMQAKPLAAPRRSRVHPAAPAPRCPVGRAPCPASPAPSPPWRWACPTGSAWRAPSRRSRLRANEGFRAGGGGLDGCSRGSQARHASGLNRTSRQPGSSMVPPKPQACRGAPDRISPSGISAMWNSSTMIRCHSTHLARRRGGAHKFDAVSEGAAARAQGWPLRCLSDPKTERVQ